LASLGGGLVVGAMVVGRMLGCPLLLLLLLLLLLRPLLALPHVGCVISKAQQPRDFACTMHSEMERFWSGSAYGDHLNATRLALFWRWSGSDWVPI